MRVYYGGAESTQSVGLSACLFADMFVYLAQTPSLLPSPSMCGSASSACLPGVTFSPCTSSPYHAARVCLPACLCTHARLCRVSGSVYECAPAVRFLVFFFLRVHFCAPLLHSPASPPRYFKSECNILLAFAPTSSSRRPCLLVLGLFVAR